MTLYSTDTYLCSKAWLRSFFDTPVKHVLVQCLVKSVIISLVCFFKDIAWALESDESFLHQRTTWAGKVYSWDFFNAQCTVPEPFFHWAGYNCYACSHKVQFMIEWICQAASPWPFRSCFMATQNGKRSIWSQGLALYVYVSNRDLRRMAVCVVCVFVL